VDWLKIGGVFVFLCWFATGFQFDFELMSKFGIFIIGMVIWWMGGTVFLMRFGFLLSLLWFVFSLPFLSAILDLGKILNLWIDNLNPALNVRGKD